jgi:hypothetical protein
MGTLFLISFALLTFALGSFARDIWLGTDGGLYRFVQTPRCA